MLAVKGKCHLCQGQVSIMNPAMVCFECEKFHHGQCIDPPKSVQEMEQYVRTNVQWYCNDCARGGNARVDERTKDDKKDVEDRLNLIIELRDVLIKIEDALAQMKQNNDELDDHTRALKENNVIMRKRINLHEKLGFVVPKNLDDWIEKRKERQIDRQNFKPKKDPTLRTHKKDEFKKFLKKHTFFGNTEKRKEMKQKKKEAKERKGEDRKKEREIGFGRQFMREGLIYGSYRALLELSSNWRMQLILLFILIAYTIIGGFIFYWIEGEHERTYLARISEERDRIEKEIDTIRTLNLMVKFDEPTMMNVTNAWFSKYYDFVHTQIEDYGKNLLAMGENPVWNLYSSVYFCAVTITTIGYGDMTPVTNTGKIVMMVYALLGIPLYFALLATSAKTLTTLIKIIMKYCSCRCKKAPTDNFNEKAKNRQSLSSFIGLRRQYDYLPLWLMLLLTFIYISIGAVVYYFLEKEWGFLNGYYFIFTSITTIGFGDLVPSSTWVIIFSTVYFLVGLTIAAITIHVLVERFELSLESAHKKLEDYSEKHTEKKKAERSQTN